MQGPVKVWEPEFVLYSGWVEITVHWIGIISNKINYIASAKTKDHIHIHRILGRDGFPLTLFAHSCVEHHALLQAVCRRTMDFFMNLHVQDFQITLGCSLEQTSTT